MQVDLARSEYRSWLLATRDLSSHTIRAYDADVAAVQRYVGSRASVREITTDALIAFMHTQRTAGLSARSLRRRASGIRGFCRWLVSRGLLDADPWAGTTVSVGRSRHLPKIVPASDLSHLVAHLRREADIDDFAGEEVLRNPHEATTLLAVTLMLATGVRVNEVVSIRCQSIDVRARTIRVLGKGRRERQVFLTNKWLTTLVLTYLRTRVALGVQHEQLLISRRLGPLTPAAMRSRLHKAAERAGMATQVTPHMLRHTAATQLIEAGVDIRFIQRLLGHASLSTTEIYTHVSDHVLLRVVSDADVLGRSLRVR
jgi:site-specific recombinase XerD